MPRPSGERWSSLSQRGAEEDTVGDLERGAEPVGGDLVRAQEPEPVRVGPYHVTDPAAKDTSGLGGKSVGLVDGDGVVAEVRQYQVAQHHAAVGVRPGQRHQPWQHHRRDDRRVGDRHPRHHRAHQRLDPARPDGRIPARFAEAAAWPLSDRVATVIGAILPVDGGASA